MIPAAGEWEEIFTHLRRIAGTAPTPSVTRIAGKRPDPFRVLVSTIISLRTKDEVTIESSTRLFAAADTPAAILALSEEEIGELIYPAGFYRMKAGNLRTVSSLLIEKHEGRVPQTLEELLALPGVGRKTANLTLGLAFGIPAICVDTHVHRIPNRLGWISTRTPDESEAALAAILPEACWIEINTLLVAFGKQVCTPQSPWCGRCPLFSRCERIGVERYRS